MERDAAPLAASSLADGMQGKEILCQDGPVGRVADVLIDPATERPLYLVWREAVVVTREVSIPIDYIECVEDRGIVLRVEREAIDRLPHFWTAAPNTERMPSDGGY